MTLPREPEPHRDTETEQTTPPTRHQLMLARAVQRLGRPRLFHPPKRRGTRS